MASLCQVVPEVIPFSIDEENEQLFSNLLSSFDKYEGEFRELFENEKTKLLIDDTIKNNINLSPSEIHTITRDVISSLNIEETITETDVTSVVNVGHQAQDTVQFLQTLDFTCEDCVRHDKVSSFRQIQAGDHIRFHRCFVGINLYNHHAIVTRVHPDPTDPTLGEMTLVHFQKTETWEKTVIRETKQFDVKSEKIDVVRYSSQPFPRSEIIKRANKMADKFEQRKQEESYSVMSNSCEDKSNEIASGMKYGNQFKTFSAYVKSVISWVVKVILKIAIRFFDKMKPLIRGFAHIAVIASLLSLVDQIISLRWKKDQGILCLKCFDREHNKLMSSLIFCLLSLGVSVTFHVSWIYMGICSAAALAIPSISSFLIDTIMPIIQPASNVPKPVVRRSNMIKVGDVITFPYVGLYHEGVVVDQSASSTSNPNMVKVTVVHYNYPGMFGTRTVVREDFYFDLGKVAVYVYDFSGEPVLPAQEVVDRALDKIGSQDFNSLHNRSSHLSRYCKVFLFFIS